jgi:hypothetical protein
LPIVAGIARALRSPGVLVLIAALVGAFFVSRGCQRSQVRLTKDQAVVVGERALDFEPENHTVRMVLRGVPPKRYWGVSYWIRNPSGRGYRKLTVVLVDANTGKIDKVYVRRP